MLFLPCFLDLNMFRDEVSAFSFRFEFTKSRVSLKIKT
jgi:hypothetical protein